MPGATVGCPEPPSDTRSHRRMPWPPCTPFEATMHHFEAAMQPVEDAMRLFEAAMRLFEDAMRMFECLTLGFRLATRANA